MTNIGTVVIPVSTSFAWAYFSNIIYHIPLHVCFLLSSWSVGVPRLLPVPFPCHSECCIAPLTCAPRDTTNLPIISLVLQFSLQSYHLNLSPHLPTPPQAFPQSFPRTLFLALLEPLVIACLQLGHLNIFLSSLYLGYNVYCLSLYL